MNTPNIEALKEIARYVIFLAVGWVITETLKQVDMLPATVDLHVSVFTYMLPVQATVTTVLGLVGRYVDKWLHTVDTGRFAAWKGLLPF